MITKAFVYAHGFIHEYEVGKSTTGCDKVREIDYSAYSRKPILVITYENGNVQTFFGFKFSIIREPEIDTKSKGLRDTKHY